MRALGNIFDIGTGWVPVDLDAADGATGKRISLAGASGITFVIGTGVGPASDLTFNIQQHTAYVSGTSNDLDAAAVSTSRGVTEWFIKHEVTLDNDESWERVTQAEASAVVLAGATYGANQKKVAIHVEASQLGTGYTHVSLNATAANGTAHLAYCDYYLTGLRYKRRPDKLGNLLQPGAADA